MHTAYGAANEIPLLIAVVQKPPLTPMVVYQAELEVSRFVGVLIYIQTFSMRIAKVLASLCIRTG